MAEDQPNLLIYSAPGSLGDSLSAFIAHGEQAGAVSYVTTVSGVLEAISQHPPALIILNLYPLKTETLDLLLSLKARQPGLRRLILAASSAQAEQIGTDGADDILVWGFLPEALQAKIEKLLTLTDIQPTGRRSAASQ